MNESDPLDIEINDLANRLERVRVLYEQYFMGFERTEPAIARKDLDRRFYDLRKTRFPTTAKRFKFQTLVQRYNTLQQHWMRTCREIENGTYRKHRIKARKLFASEDSHAQTEDGTDRIAAAANAKERAAADLAELMDQDVDLDAEFGKALSQLETNQTSKSPLARLTGAKGLSGLQTERSLTGPKLKLPDIQVREKAEDGSSRPGTSLSPLQIRKSAVPSSLGKSPSPAGSPPLPVRPLSPTEKAAELLKNEKEGSLGRALPPGPAPLRSAPKVQLPTAPGPIKLPPTPTGTGIGGATGGVPPHSPSARAATQARSEGTAPTAPSAAKSTGVLSDERIRALHASYSDARKQTNASAVSYEKLAQSIKDTEEKLRVQSKGRAVDFEVKIQGGKAVLTPKLK